MQHLNAFTVFLNRGKARPARNHPQDTYVYLQLQCVLTALEPFPVSESQFSLLLIYILADPEADSRGEGKSKRAEKYCTEKNKERREEPLGTMSYQTSSKRSPLFSILIGQKNKNVFWHQSEGRTAATVWNWSGKTLFPGALLAVLYFSPCHIFPPV